MSRADLDSRNTTAIARAVTETIAGQDAANKALHELRQTLADPDLLHDCLQAVLLAGGPERLRAFVRVVQKRLEGAA